jgi:zinc transporter 9
MAGSSTKAVYAAIAANSVVAVAKGAGFMVSGSPGMLSEAIHSVADVGNQSLLALGIKISGGEATAARPYGSHRERYVWALISAVGIFFLGCGVTLYHGVHAFLHPENQAGGLLLPIGILLFSAVVEGWSLWVAVREVHKQRGGKAFWRFLRESEDPMLVAIILEDSAATSGVLLALLGVGLTQLTGEPRFDAAGSILIALLMGALAIALVQRNRSLLVGEAPQREVLDRVVAHIRAQPEVEDVKSVRALVLGSGAIKFAADIDFDGRIIAREVLDAGAWQRIAPLSGDALRADLEQFGEEIVSALGKAVDRIEASAVKAVPELRAIDLEAD